MSDKSLRRIGTKFTDLAFVYGDAEARKLLTPHETKLLARWEAGEPKREAARRRSIAEFERGEQRQQRAERIALAAELPQHQPARRAANIAAMRAVAGVK